MPYPEDETMEALAARPVEFEDVVRPHLEYLYSLGVRLCRNRTLAEDLVQDTLLRAFRGFARLRNRERPRLWLTRILTRCHYDRFRSEHEADETLRLNDNARSALIRRCLVSLSLKKKNNGCTPKGLRRSQ